MGVHYATQLACDYHYDLLLVSNQAQELHEVATRLAADYHITAIDYCADLSDQNAAEQLFDFTKQQQIEVDVLINNAGILIFRELAQTPMPKLQTLLMLHMVTLTKLCKLFGEEMCQRRHGYILNMSSMTAWMTMPGIQCYNASKAYGGFPVAYTFR